MSMMKRHEFGGRASVSFKNAWTNTFYRNEFFKSEFGIQDFDDFHFHATLRDIEA